GGTCYRNASRMSSTRPAKTICARQPAALPRLNCTYTRSGRGAGRSMLTTKPATNLTATPGLDTVTLKISRTFRVLTSDTVRYRWLAALQPYGKRSLYRTVNEAF